MNYYLSGRFSLDDDGYGEGWSTDEEFETTSPHRTPEVRYNGYSFQPDSSPLNINTNLPPLNDPLPVLSNSSIINQFEDVSIQNHANSNAPIEMDSILKILSSVARQSLTVQQSVTHRNDYSETMPTKESLLNRPGPSVESYELSNGTESYLHHDLADRKRADYFSSFHEGFASKKRRLSPNRGINSSPFSDDEEDFFGGMGQSELENEADYEELVEEEQEFEQEEELEEALEYSPISSPVVAAEHGSDDAMAMDLNAEETRLTDEEPCDNRLEEFAECSIAADLNSTKVITEIAADFNSTEVITEGSMAADQTQQTENSVNDVEPEIVPSIKDVDCNEIELDSCSEEKNEANNEGEILRMPEQEVKETNSPVLELPALHEQHSQQMPEIKAGVPKEAIIAEIIPSLTLETVETEVAFSPPEEEDAEKHQGSSLATLKDVFKEPEKTDDGIKPDLGQGTSERGLGLDCVPQMEYFPIRKAPLGSRLFKNLPLSQKGIVRPGIAGRKLHSKSKPASAKRKLPADDYNLLVQLPAEMRPLIPLNLRSRVPTAMRQTYLHRWIQVHLELASPAEIGQNPECVAAVEQAVQAETEIFMATGSKIGYVNRSSRDLAAARASNGSANASRDREANVLAALRATGLIPDENEEAEIEGGMEVDEEPHTTAIMGTVEVKRVGEVPLEGKVTEVDSKEGELEVKGDGLIPDENEGTKITGGMEVDEVLHTAVKMSTGEVNEAGEVPLEVKVTEIDSMEGEVEVKGDERKAGEPVDATADQAVETAAEIVAVTVAKSSPRMVLEKPAVVEARKLDHSPKGLEMSVQDVDGGETVVAEDVQELRRKLQQTLPKQENSTMRKQVVVFVKEHLRPLYKSGVISRDDFVRAVEKTSSKVLEHHLKNGGSSAEFLLQEGPKVRKLADEYVNLFQRQQKNSNK